VDKTILINQSSQETPEESKTFSKPKLDAHYTRTGSHVLDNNPAKKGRVSMENNNRIEDQSLEPVFKQKPAEIFIEPSKNLNQSKRYEQICDELGNGVNESQ
jgi:hypothetical protein